MNRRRIAIGKKQVILASLVAGLSIAVYLNWQYAQLEGGQMVTDQTVASNYGESQLVDGQAPLIGEEVDSESYFADAKLTRQRSRDEAAAALKDMLSQADLDAEQKTIYTLQATQLAQSIETEGKIENLIKAKGFEDVMVYCDSTRVDVVVKTDGLDTAQVAQLKDIILKETDVEAENISIVEVK